MKSVWQFLALLVFITTPTTSFAVIKGLVAEPFMNMGIFGWVCETGSTESLAYSIYVGGPQGVGERIGNGLASEASEAAVDAECEHAGTNAPHRYTYMFSEAQKTEYEGELIYVYGIRPGQPDQMLSFSGVYVMPPPGQINTPTPLPDPANGDYTYGVDVSITSIILWQGPGNNPIYFKRSDDVMCYVPADESSLETLILTLYASGKRADIHCHSAATQLMADIPAAHRVYRIVGK